MRTSELFRVTYAVQDRPFEFNYNSDLYQLRHTSTHNGTIVGVRRISTYSNSMIVPIEVGFSAYGISLEGCINIFNELRKLYEVNCDVKYFVDTVYNPSISTSLDLSKLAQFYRDDKISQRVFVLSALELLKGMFGLRINYSASQYNINQITDYMMDFHLIFRRTRFIGADNSESIDVKDINLYNTILDAVENLTGVSIVGGMRLNASKISKSTDIVSANSYPLNNEICTVIL